MTVFRIETGKILNIITAMLEKEPNNRIFSSDVVNLLRQIIPKVSEKKYLRKYFLIYYSFIEH